MWFYFTHQAPFRAVRDVFDCTGLPTIILDAWICRRRMSLSDWTLINSDIVTRDQGLLSIMSNAETASARPTLFQNRLSSEKHFNYKQPSKEWVYINLYLWTSTKFSNFKYSCLLKDCMVGQILKSNHWICITPWIHGQLRQSKRGTKRW